MIKKPFLILILSLSAITALNGQVWYKGNLHTHSYWSDGDEFPERIMEWYKANGYNFVGLSDHNTFQEGEKWKKITRSKLREDALKTYLEKYGQFASYRVDSGRYSVRLKTLAEYRPLFEDKNFLIIKSEEITSRFGEKGEKHVHVNATNVQKLVGAQPGNTVAEMMQNSVNAVLEQRKATGVPMFPHINHPNFFYSITVDDMIALKGEQFFEVYNGHPLVNNYGDSTRPGMEAMWDRINIAYHDRGQPLMYGLATDDSHNYHEFGAAFSNAGRGWVMVRATALTPEALIGAMEAGDFYSSTGVVLDEVRFSGNTLTVQVKPEAGVTYTIEFVGAKKGKKSAEVLQTVKGTTATFKVTKSYRFVRARITSSKLKPNPFQEGDKEMAWTQPVSAR
ncbi:MAG: histidinol-phosphatase [Cyclobacteriaceae bacterium]|nr:histidinol-phosphatase [Cyclobacteriaceae bacterium]